ncbi:EAL domain-containing protein [Pseudomonas sp. C27(2019)]|uniref:EAL domain-containing protein n=1 Tax=Pseudomonas sp. C27(2019) TaxID=2604941 RepID=UPI0012492F9E|nr:EAL domain-containing protein [Pseudomonas sp. C27(2019)]QEY60134.1 EAL domain-containing protein [Pseudomonas sp. C27(2019)]
MFSEEKLNALIARIGLNNQTFSERQRLMGWQPSDAARLAQAADSLQQHQAEFAQQLQQHFSHFPEAAEQFEQLCPPEYIEARHAEYYQQLLHNPYNDDYVRERVRAGLIHQAIGLNPLWYLGAYRLYLDSMLKTICTDPEQTQLLSSLFKAVFLDMSLTVDSYSAAHHQSLEENQARFTRTMRGANDGIWEWDIASDRLHVSERWLEMLDLTGKEFGEHTSKNWLSRIHPDDLPLVRKAIGKHLSGHSHFLDCEHRIRKKNGDYIWVSLRGFASISEQNEQRLSGSQADISERKEHEQHMSYAAFHDPLTGLANRRQLDKLLHESMQRNQQAGSRETALLFIDLDNFKQVNDNYGHKAGDVLLIEIARRLQQCLRPGDHLGRFGGDEFVVLLDDLACLTDAEHVAQRMLDSLSCALRIDGHLLSVSASIGITVLPHSTPPSELLQAADLALYQAKMAGKAQYAHYTKDMQSAAQELRAKQEALTKGLANKSFKLLYQPIFTIQQDLKHDASNIYAVEALLRWHHNGNDYTPKSFLDLLEDSDEILEVGAWVLKTACTATRQWQLTSIPQLHCSINVSYKQLRSAYLVSLVKAALESSGLEANYLIIEIAEQHLKPNCAQSLANLRELSQLGVQIALDNFGMGHASLGYLKRFPLDILKVDKSLINNTPQDPALKDFGLAVMSLGHSLKLKVIAEGIENPEQLSLLQANNCQLAQGYLLSSPLTAQQFSALISAPAKHA